MDRAPHPSVATTRARRWKRSRASWRVLARTGAHEGSRTLSGHAPLPHGQTAGGDAACALHALISEFLARAPIPDDFAEVLMLFRPNGDIEGEGIAVGRNASVTRPPGLMSRGSQPG